MLCFTYTVLIYPLSRLNTYREQRGIRICLRNFYPTMFMKADTISMIATNFDHRLNVCEEQVRITVQRAYHWTSQSQYHDIELAKCLAIFT